MSTVPTFPSPNPDPEAALATFRECLHGEVFTERSDMLFDLTDALLTSTHRCRCPAHLSLSTEMSYGALYQGLEKGHVDEDAQLRVFLQACSDLPRLYAIDETPILRPASKTSPDRALLHLTGHSRHSHKTGVGWMIQATARLSGYADSWAVGIHAERTPTDGDKLSAAAQVITKIAAADGSRPGDRACFLLDAGYQAARVTHLVRQEDAPAEVLVRLSKNQVFYGEPGRYRGSGRPRIHGEKLAPGAGEPGIPPDAEISLQLEGFGRTRVRAWRGYHQKIQHSTRGFADEVGLPVIPGVVIRADVARLGPRGTPGSLLLWYSGTEVGSIELLALVHLYLRRFGIEHMFRFTKTHLGLGEYHAMLPESYANWLSCQLAALCELHLTRRLVAMSRLPWEREIVRPTPYRVLRGVSQSLHASWQRPSSAKHPAPGPGRPPGKRTKRRKTYPVIRKKARGTKPVLPEALTAPAAA